MIFEIRLLSTTLCSSGILWTNIPLDALTEVRSVSKLLGSTGLQGLTRERKFTF